MPTWTAPTTRASGALITASIWNTDLVENIKYLKDAPAFDGVVTLTAGTVGAPALTTISDANTGVFFPAADTVALTVGGGERLRITSAGAGVGVTPSAWASSYRVVQLSGGSLWALNSQNLLLTQNAYNDGTDYRYVASSTAVANYQMSNGTQFWSTAPSGTAGNVATLTERMRLDSSGRLLVGTPTARTLTTLDSLVQVETAGSTYQQLSLIANRNDTGGASIILGKSRGTAVNSNTIVADGDNLGFIRFQAADGVDMDSIAAQILAQVDGAPGSNDTPGRLVFSTAADGAASVTERMRITSTGTVQPGANDGGALGSGSVAWSDLFLASGGVINFANGGVTITHVSGADLLNVTDGLLSVNRSAQSAMKPAIQGSTPGLSGVFCMGSAKQSGTSAFDTGISVNQGEGGGCLVLVASRHQATGTNTAAAVYIVRFYYDGDNQQTTTYVGGSSDFVTFGKSASNTMTLTNAGDGVVYYSWFGNK